MAETLSSQYWAEGYWMNDIPTLLGIVAAIWLLLVIAAAFEAFRHKLLVDKNPVRVHVYGTRGKTSVTRLILAGLLFHFVFRPPVLVNGLCRSAAPGRGKLGAGD